jgi:hypothetical protein
LCHERDTPPSPLPEARPVIADLAMATEVTPLARKVKLRAAARRPCIASRFRSAISLRDPDLVAPEPCTLRSHLTRRSIQAGPARDRPGEARQTFR